MRLVRNVMAFDAADSSADSAFWLAPVCIGWDRLKRALAGFVGPPCRTFETRSATATIRQRRICDRRAPLVCRYGARRPAPSFGLTGSLAAAVPTARTQRVERAAKPRLTRPS